MRIGALEYLQSLPYVRPEAIALLGWSNGAMAALATVAHHTRSRPPGLAHDFRTAVAFYPRRQPTLDRADWMPPVAPVHIFIGELDDWTPSEECAELVKVAKAANAPMDLMLYPGAFHDFDDPQMPVHVRTDVATPSGRATLGTNPEARADSIQRVTRLLRDALDKP